MHLPEFKITTPGLFLKSVIVPWDTEAFGVPVAQIDEIDVINPERATSDYMPMTEWISSHGIAIVTCRLPQDKLRESIFLEDQGFRFIEMVFQAQLDLKNHLPVSSKRLKACIAAEEDLDDILDIAGTVFRNERYFCDPRLNPNISDHRYCTWAISAFWHKSQELYVVKDCSTNVAFFVIEMLADGCCYWHLNAVSSRFQGRGYGLAAACTMITLAKDQGANCIRTSFASRNHRALNLNARIGYRFMPPLVTFHWVRF